MLIICSYFIHTQFMDKRYNYYMVKISSKPEKGGDSRLIKTLCEQFLFSNRVAFHSRYQIPGSLDTEISFKNLETGMILKMTLSGVIPKQSTDATDLIPVLGCVSAVGLYKEVL